MTAPYDPPPHGPHQPRPADQWRPSEADRQGIADRLRRAVDEGRLDLMEYERRLRASETAATVAELHQLLADLPQPVMTQIGELAVTETGVYTPVGLIPLRGAQWSVYDHWRTEQKIPTWAIVVAIVGFFCLTVFSLLFLLAKETRVNGVVDVMVANGQQHYATRIPVHHHQQIHYVHQQVHYVRSLSSA